MSTLPALPTAPSDTIQRILFLCPTVHIYALPPLTSNKGYTASAWTADPARHIFTARLRVLETSPVEEQGNEVKAKVSTTILFEDPSTGELFASALYTSPATVEATLDSSRFFAVRVTGENNQSAFLGIGFEERGDAIDFGICLQESRRVLGFEAPESSSKGKAGSGTAKAKGKAEAEKKDWSLKEGETIKVNIGPGHGRKRESTGGGGETEALFSLKPPPGGGEGIPMLAPPPSAGEARKEKRRSREIAKKAPLGEVLGFDDGEFEDFQ